VSRRARRRRPTTLRSVEIAIILTVVLVGMVFGDIALVRALKRRRGDGDRDDGAG